MVEPSEVFGVFDYNLKLVEKACNVQIAYRGDEISIMGDDPETAEFVINELFKVAESGQKLDEQKVNYIITLASEGVSYTQSNLQRDVICYTTKGRPIKPKTIGQKEYVDAIKKNDICFGVGPAGTGKTYIAVAMAVSALPLSLMSTRSQLRLSMIETFSSFASTPYLRQLSFAAPKAPASKQRNLRQ